MNDEEVPGWQAPQHKLFCRYCADFRFKVGGEGTHVARREFQPDRGSLDSIGLASRSNRATHVGMGSLYLLYAWREAHAPNFPPKPQGQPNTPRALPTWHWPPVAGGSGVVPTSWALLALMAAKCPDTAAVARGIAYLVAEQRPCGDWPRPEHGSGPS